MVTLFTRTSGFLIILFMAFSFLGCSSVKLGNEVDPLEEGEIGRDEIIFIGKIKVKQTQVKEKASLEQRELENTARDCANFIADRLAWELEDHKFNVRRTTPRSGDVYLTGTLNIFRGRGNPTKASDPKYDNVQATHFYLTVFIYRYQTNQPIAQFDVVGTYEKRKKPPGRYPHSPYEKVLNTLAHRIAHYFEKRLD